MFKSNNENVCQIKMTFELKKYKLRKIFLSKKHVEISAYASSDHCFGKNGVVWRKVFAKMHLRIYPRNICRCISELIF